MKYTQMSERSERVRLNRRVFVGGSVAAATAAILAACGGNPDVNTPTAAPAAATTTGANTTGASSAAAATAKPNAPATSTPQASGSSVAAAPGGTPQPGGRLIIADPQADQPLDPFKTPWHSTAQFLVFTSYVSKAPDLSYVPYTFESW
ncbi:MAG TPA: hypothetical protein VIG44_09820, partial [Thermomicrobiales bacterium]